jgi:hypothetical protein
MFNINIEMQGCVVLLGMVLPKEGIRNCPDDLNNSFVG